MRTDYASHDGIYQRYRAQCAMGWDQSEAAYRERELQLDRILSSGRAPTSGRLLEMGCGAGNISIWLAKRGYEVCGVDVSPTAIQWAVEKARVADSTARFSVGDVCELAGSEQAPFDCVLDGHCHHCIIGSDRPRLLATASRLLRPGGYLLVDTMCGPEVDPAVIKGYAPQSRCTLCGDIATRYFGLPKDIQAEVQQAGFQILHTEILPEEAHSNMIIEARKPWHVLGAYPNNPSGFGRSLGGPEGLGPPRGCNDGWLRSRRSTILSIESPPSSALPAAVSLDLGPTRGHSDRLLSPDTGG